VRPPGNVLGGRFVSGRDTPGPPQESDWRQLGNLGAPRVPHHRPNRFLPTALFALVALAAPSPTTADMCGGTAAVEPASGEAGTVFVFDGNVGAPSDLWLFRNDQSAGHVFLAGDGFVRYAIQTQPGDGGEWRAHAAVRGSPECGAEALFTVVEAPEQAATTDMLPWLALPLILVVAGVTGLALALRRNA
jgi:hypothetical protein